MILLYSRASLIHAIIHSRELEVRSVSLFDVGTVKLAYREADSSYFPDNGHGQTTPSNRCARSPRPGSRPTTPSPTTASARAAADVSAEAGYARESIFEAYGSRDQRAPSERSVNLRGSIAARSAPGTSRDPTAKAVA